MAADDAHRDQANEDIPAAVKVLEQELAQLVRALEAVQRRRSYPLERAQYILLTLLEAKGPQPIAELAASLLLDDSTVTRQVAAMEAQALIDRRPNPKDGRSILIHATRRGLAVAKRMRALRMDRITQLFGDWDEAEREAFATLLVKFNASLRRSLAARE